MCMFYPLYIVCICLSVCLAASWQIKVFIKQYKPVIPPPRILLLWSSGTLDAKLYGLPLLNTNTFLSATRCNISFGARDFHSAAPAIWNSLSSNIRSCETLNMFINKTHVI